LGVWDEFGDLAFQFVNVREQCAFVHRNNPDAATRKAGDLIAASVAALSLAGVTDRGSRMRAYGARSPVTAAIDLVRCRGCEDCEIVCGLQAVQVVASNGTRLAQVDPTRCLGCGVCMAVCSSGAILASDSSDAQVAAQLSAMGDLTDKTVIFSCNWGAYSAVEAAGVQRLKYDPSVRLVRLMCSGRTHVGLVMQAFVQGAARVLVLACGHEDGASQCHYQTGNDQARRSAEQAQGLLDLLGIDPTRLAVVEMRPGDGARFVATVDEFVSAPLTVAPKG
jgi:coenzyme F420-reducing hydrogenase delta subunit/NAD-dependent dihydropyrimidine dehydrogenase PreA subunit